VEQQRLPHDQTGTRGNNGVVVSDTAAAGGSSPSATGAATADESHSKRTCVCTSKAGRRGPGFGHGGGEWLDVAKVPAEGANAPKQLFRRVRARLFGSFGGLDAMFAEEILVSEVVVVKPLSAHLADVAAGCAFVDVCVCVCVSLFVRAGESVCGL
jgi:hypothetical protein